MGVRVQLSSLAALLCVTVVASSSIYDYRGTCSSTFGLVAESCSDVYAMCWSSACYDYDSTLLYTCVLAKEMKSCWGLATTQGAIEFNLTGVNDMLFLGTCRNEFGLSATQCDLLPDEFVDCVCDEQRSSTINYRCDFHDGGSCHARGYATSPQECVMGHGLLPTTCVDTSAFVTAGCTEFSCVEYDGDIDFTCSKPFSCTEHLGRLDPNDGVTTYGSIVLISIVFGSTAGGQLLIAGIVWSVMMWLHHREGTPTTSDTAPFCVRVRQWSSSLPGLCFSGIRSVYSSLMSLPYSFIVQPNLRSDGSVAPLLEAWVACNVWVAFATRYRYLFPRSPVRQLTPSPFAIPPVMLARGFTELVGNAFITMALAFLFGAAAVATKPSDRITATQDGITRRLAPSIQTRVYVTTTLIVTGLTKVMMLSHVVSMWVAKASTRYQWWVLCFRVLITLSFLGFAMGHSIYLVSVTKGPSAAHEHISSVFVVFGSSWLSTQFVDLFMPLLKRLLSNCIKFYRKKTKGGDSKPSTAVLPVCSGPPLDPPRQISSGIDALVVKSDDVSIRTD